MGPDTYKGTSKNMDKHLWSELAHAIMGIAKPSADRPLS
jgi:hypothetical protein